MLAIMPCGMGCTCSPVCLLSNFSKSFGSSRSMNIHRLYLTPAVPGLDTMGLCMDCYECAAQGIPSSTSAPVSAWLQQIVAGREQNRYHDGRLTKQHGNLGKSLLRRVWNALRRTSGKFRGCKQGAVVGCSRLHKVPLLCPDRYCDKHIEGRAHLQGMFQHMYVSCNNQEIQD